MPRSVFLLIYDDVQVSGFDVIHLIFFSKEKAEEAALRWNTMMNRQPWDHVIVVEKEVSDA